jgi:hypothetical protein
MDFFQKKSEREWVCSPMLASCREFIMRFSDLMLYFYLFCYDTIFNHIYFKYIIIVFTFS